MPERYQREIEEILKKSGSETGAPSKRQKSEMSFVRLIWLNIKQSLGGRGRLVSPGRVMLVAVCLLLAALMFRFVAPGFVGMLAWAGLLLFIVGYAMFFVQPRSVEKRWRGQPLEDRKETWWDRVRRRLTRR